MQKTFAILSLTVLAAVAAGAAIAARPVQSRARADYVIVGTVNAVYARQTPGYWQYLVEPKVETVERGTDVGPGDFFRAFCYRRKPGVNSLQFDTAGHTLIPREGQRLKVFVLRLRGRNEGVYPDWAEVLPGSQG